MAIVNKAFASLLLPMLVDTYIVKPSSLATKFLHQIVVVYKVFIVGNTFQYIVCVNVRVGCIRAYVNGYSWVPIIIPRKRVHDVGTALIPHGNATQQRIMTSRSYDGVELYIVIMPSRMSADNDSRSRGYMHLGHCVAVSYQLCAACPVSCSFAPQKFDFVSNTTLYLSYLHTHRFM